MAGSGSKHNAASQYLSPPPPLVPLPPSTLMHTSPSSSRRSRRLVGIQKGRHMSHVHFQKRKVKSFVFIIQILHVVVKKDSWDIQTEVKMQLSAFYFQGWNRDFKKGRGGGGGGGGGGGVVGKYLYKNAGNLLACFSLFMDFEGFPKELPHLDPLPDIALPSTMHYILFKSFRDYLKTGI